MARAATANLSRGRAHLVLPRQRPSTELPGRLLVGWTELQPGLVEFRFRFTRMVGNIYFIGELAI